MHASYIQNIPPLYSDEVATDADDAQQQQLSTAKRSEAEEPPPPPAPPEPEPTITLPPNWKMAKDAEGILFDCYPSFWFNSI